MKPAKMVAKMVDTEESVLVGHNLKYYKFVNFN